MTSHEDDPMTKEWTAGSLRELALGYMRSGVLLAAAELDVFGVLARESMSAGQLALTLGTDRRATRTLADALVALGLLEKRDGRYSLAPGTLDTLGSLGPATQLPFMHHHANGFRAWSRLAEVVETGHPAPTSPSIRGVDADHHAYQEIMDVNAREAPEVVAALGPLEFESLLDVGCGPGTWTIALLRAVPGAQATVFDLPDTLPITRRHIEAAGLMGRVEFVSGDYRSDEPLPGKHDCVWISAVAHLNDREQNRDLFAKVHAALKPGGCLMVRDIVMNEARTEPLFGALFSVLMLVRTEFGGTFTLSEFLEDLDASGFENPKLFRHQIAMHSVIRAWRRSGDPR